MKVFILIRQWPYDEDDIKGVYSSVEKAEDVRETLVKEGGHRFADLRIEEWYVD